MFLLLLALCIRQRYLIYSWKVGLDSSASGRVIEIAGGLHRSKEEDDTSKLSLSIKSSLSKNVILTSL